MADNKLELVIEVDANKANASIKSVNTGLSGMERAAVQAARNASTGIDGMTASMVKGATAGNLLAESIKKGAEWIKEWTVGAAQYAAHTSRMEAVTIALAKAHGNTTGETNKAVEAIKRVGFSTQDALHAVDRLIVADLNLSKSEGLAKVAKDAAAIENITPGEALEKLLLAIESGASRGLRTMGIFVELQKEVRLRELQLGRTLEESEVKQIRYNAVMREAAKITGAHGAAASTAEAQMHALAREVNELREAVGDRFQGQFRSMIGHLRELIGFLKENADLLARFGQAAIWTAGAIATYAIAQKILGIAAAVRVLTVALAANPWTLLATGVALGGALIYKVWKDNQDAVEAATTKMRNDALRQDLISGKVKLEDARKQGYTDDQLREIISGRELLPGKTWQAPDTGLQLKKERSGPSEDDIRVMADVRKRQAEAEKQSADYYQRAIEERQNTEREAARARIADSMKIIESTNSETEAAKQALNVFRLSNQEYDAGVQKIREEERREIQQLSSFVDSKSGQVRHFTLAPETLSRIHAATREKIASFDQTFNEEESRRIAQIWKALLEREQRLTEEQEQWQNKLDDQRRGARRSAVEQGKDIALVQLESVDARTIQDKLRVEAAKTAIEVNAIRERTKIELETIDARTAADIKAAERAAVAKGQFDEQYMSEIRGKIQKLGQEEKDALNRSAATEIDVAQFKGANTMRRTVTEQYQSIFDSLKRQAGSVFDALLTKSQSVWQAIGNSLKSAILGAIKEVVSSRVAAALLQAFVPGANVSFQHGGSAGRGGGGMLGGLLGGLPGLAAVPAFASAAGGTFGGGGTFGSGPVGGNPMILSATGGGGLGLGKILPGVFGAGGGQSLPAGIPAGGTPPFVPSSGSVGGAAASGAGIFSKAGLARFLPGVKPFFGFGENDWTNMGGGRMATGGWISQYGSLGDKLTALGKSNAAMMGGGMLALNGLQRGGLLGMGEDVAGGALLGFKYGGGMGAAIGAAAGLAAGAIRMLFESPEQEAKRLIKQLYQVNIDTAMAKQIADIAKQKYAGHVSIAVRDPDVRKMIELYAAGTGQHMPLSATTPHGASILEQGGKLYQAPTYLYGNPYTFQSNLPTAGGLSTGTRRLAR